MAESRKDQKMKPWRGWCFVSDDGSVPNYVFRSKEPTFGCRVVADLFGADLFGADLHGVDLHGADLHGADLSAAIGLADVLRTLLNQKGEKS